jgi:RNA polymerase sigma factor (sigma-70 family)
VALGQRIRAGLENLLNHLLGSGFVADVLLERTKAEMARKGCAPGRRAGLAAAFANAASVLESARVRCAKGYEPKVQLNVELAAAFAELVSVLNPRPSTGLELFALLESRFSMISAGNGGRPGEPAQVQLREFALVNLLEHEACRAFLKEAARLRAVALLARNEMVGANLRLVVAIAKKMRHAFLPMEDLIQEGNFGLLTAAERFDERLGNRFSTFAVSLIQSAMRRENDNQGRTIRLPVHQCDALRKLEQARRVLEDRLQRQPNVWELAEETGFECNDVLELGVLKEGTASLTEKFGDGSDATLETFLSDPGSLLPFYGETDLGGGLDPFLLNLDGVQRTVVSHLYGIGGAPLLSLDETAALLGLAPTEIRRVHNLALKTLRGALAGAGGVLACAA